jgi:hypothetical protein
MIDSHARDRRLRLFIFLILLASYLLAYISTPDSADGDALLAVSAAWVRTGTADVSTIGAQDAQFSFDMSRMGVFGIDGALYSKKGLAPSLALLPFTFAAQVAPWLPLRATAMLFNPLVTAFTGALLYTLVRTLGFRPRTALVSALLYGWATTAAVYTKTLFGEPLAALFLVIATLYAIRHRQSQQTLTLLIAGTAIGFAAGINLTYLLPGALIGLYAIRDGLTSLLARPDRSDFARLLKTGLIYAAPILLSLLTLAAYNAVRFGSPLDSGYYLSEGEGFNRPFLLGILGLTISPYRGLLWYAPVLILALPGTWLLLKRWRTETLLLIAIIVSQFAVYASWWSWHGGVVWGPRFLVPVLPLMALLVAPIIEAAALRRWMRIGLGTLVIFSLGVQLLGILLSPYSFYGILSGRYGSGDMSAVVATMRDDILYDLSANAALGHLQLLTQGAPLDPAWLRGSPIILVAAIAVALLAVAILKTPDLKHEDTEETKGHEVRHSSVILRVFVSKNFRPPSLVLALLCIVALNIVAASQNDSPDVQAVHRLETPLDHPAPLLVASNHYGSALLDIESHHVLSMAAPTTPDDPQAVAMWQHAQTLDEQLWYVTWFAPGDPRNWVEQRLWQDAAFAYERSTDGHRALLFDLLPAALRQDGGWRFGDIVLARWGVERRGDERLVALEWRAEADIPQDLAWFVHVLNSDGEIIAQQDRAPQGGYRPTSTWRRDERVRDNLYFPHGSGAVSLRIGWVDPLKSQRLTTFTIEGAQVPEDFITIAIP